MDTSAHAPMPDRFITRYRQLQFRAIVVVVGLVSVLVGTSNWLIVKLVETHFTRAHIRDTVLLGGQLADRLSVLIVPDQRDGLESGLNEALRDPRLAFVCVEAPDGTTIASAANNQHWLDSFAGAGAGWNQDRSLVLSRPVLLGDPSAPEARVYRVPIYRGGKATGPDRGDLTGYVVVGVVDPIKRAAMTNIRATALAVVCCLCLLAIPITVALIRRLTRPVRRIARAAAVLAAGGRPPAVAIKRSDEIGVLARTFDDMAQKLDAAHGQLMQANADLEKQVDLRTRELERVNDLLRREIDTKNDFLRTVSHDLNAPLRNIAGMTRTIERRFGQKLPDEVVVRLGRIRANACLQSSMLDDLLELSRLRTRPGEPEDVDLEKLIDELIATLGNDIAQRGIQCHVRRPLPVIHVERNLCRQLFLNLLDNAVKHMGDREPARISITHRIVGEMLDITVADTGPGIEESEHERIFQVFRRGANVSGSSLPETPGRGIGLTGVRMVVQRWGGSVRVVSEVGRGSEFIVSIPVDLIVREGADDAIDVGPSAHPSDRAA